MKKTISLLKLKSQYRLVCQEYIKKFENKHGYSFSYWINNEIGGIASFIDEYYFNFSDIVYDINNKCEKELIFKWFDECVANPEKIISFYSYVNGLRYEDIINYEI